MNNLPAALTKVTADLVQNRWNFLVSHGTDTGGSPFVSVEAKKDERRPIRITWHTRETGTYRLFSCLIGQSHATLTHAVRAIKESPDA